MFDPRNRSDSDNLSIVKSFGVFAAIAYGGVHVANRYNRSYSYAARRVNEARQLIANRVTGQKPVALFQPEDLIETRPNDFLREEYGAPRNIAEEIWGEAGQFMDIDTGLEKDPAFYTVDENIRQWGIAFDQTDSPQNMEGFRPLGLDETLPTGSIVPTNIDPLENLVNNGMQRSMGLTKDDFFDVNMVLANPAQTTNLAEAVAEIGRGSSAQHFDSIEKNYPGIKAVLDKLEHDKLVNVTRTRQTANGHAIELRDANTGKKHWVELPNWRTGFINVKGASYRTLERIYIPGDIRPKEMHAISFGTDVMGQISKSAEGYLASRGVSLENTIMKVLKEDLKKTLGYDAVLGNDMASHVKDLIDRTIQKRTYEYAGETNTYSALVQRYSFEQMDPLVEHLQDPAIKKEFQHYLRFAQGARIRNVHQMFDSEGNPTNAFHDAWSTIQIEAMSEQALLKGKIASRIPMWNFPFMPVIKQAQQRLDWMHGVPISGLGGARLDKVRIAAQVGNVATDILDKMHEMQTSTIPGRVANLAFVFEDKNLSPTGELSNIGDGGTGFVIREKKFAPGRLNIEDFRGSVPGQAQVIFKMKNIDGSMTESADLVQIMRDIRENKNPVLKKGLRLGYDPVTKKPVTLDSDVIVTHIDDDVNIATIRYQKIIDMQGGAKAALSKAQVETLLLPEEINKSFREMGYQGKQLSKVLRQGYAENGIEFLLNGGMKSKYKGGGLGLGIMMKTLNDISFLRRLDAEQLHDRYGKSKYIDLVTAKKMSKVKKDLSSDLKKVVGFFLGSSEVDNLVDRIEIDDEFGVGVVWKPNVDTGDADAFRRILKFDTLISREDWSGLQKEAKALEKRIRDLKSHSGDRIAHYQMTHELAAEYGMAKLNANDAHIIPTILMHGKNLKVLSIRAPMIQHASSARPVMRFAGAMRGIHGYGGGFKLTIDHLRNAQLKGLTQYSSYLYRLMDYNMDYLENKVRSATTGLLSDADFKIQVGPTASDPAKVVIGREGDLQGKRVRIIDFEDKKWANLRDLLAQDYNAQSTMTSVRHYTLTKDGLNALGRHISDKDLESSIVKGGELDLQTAIDQGVLGTRGASISLIRDETMRELFEATTKRGKDEVVVLKMPFGMPGADRLGEKPAYVVLHDFDYGNAFELLMRDPVSGEQKVKAYTGSAFHTNQVSVMGHMAALSIEKNRENITSDTRRSLESRYTSAIKMYQRELGKAFSGKSSPIRRTVIETGMPFSTLGQLRSMDEHIAYGLKSGRGSLYTRNNMFQFVGMHQDHVVRLISQDQIKSMSEATHLARKSDWLEKMQKRLRHSAKLVDDVLEGQEPAMDNLVQTISKINTKRLPTEAFNIIEDVKRGLLTLRDFKDLPKTLTTDQFMEMAGTDFSGASVSDESFLRLAASPASEDRLRFMHTMKQKLETTVRMLEPGRQDALLGRVVMESIKDMKEGRLEITGLGQATPETVTAGQFAVLFPMTEAGVSKDAAKVLADHNVKTNMTPEHSHIFLSRLSALARGRDFDKDTIGFITTGLHALDERAKSLGMTRTFSSMIGLSPDKAKAMSLEAVGALVDAHTIAEVATPDGKIKRLPANVSSMAMTKTLEEIEQSEYLKVHSEVRPFLEERLKLAGHDLKDKDVTAWMDRYLKQSTRRAQEAWGGRYEFKLRVIAGLKDENELPEGYLGRLAAKTDAVKSASSRIAEDIATMINPMEVAEKQSERLRELMGVGHMSEENAKLYSVITDATKRDFASYQKVFRESAERIVARKLDTAVSYNTGEALAYLAESSALNERQKMFISLLSDKVLPQHALNSKHGVPLIMNDLIKKIRVMMDPYSKESMGYLKESYGNEWKGIWKGIYEGRALPERFFEDMQKGHYLIEDIEPVVKELNKYGYKKRTESATFELYDKYFKDKDFYLGKVVEAHHDVLQDMLASETVRTGTKDEIRNAHAKKVDAKMASYASTYKGNPFFQQRMEEMFYDPLITVQAYTDSQEARKNLLGTEAKPKTGMVEAHLDSFFQPAEMTELFKDTARVAALYKEQKGHSVLENKAAHAIRNFKAEASQLGEGKLAANILDVLQFARTRLVERAAKDAPSVVANAAERLITRWANYIYNTNVKINAYGNERRGEAAIRIANRERYLLSRLHEEKLAAGSTVFRSGSVTEALSGKINKTLSSVADNELLKRMSRSRVGAVVAGLFVGAVAGQTMNQAFGGYAVPDLGNIKGLGGEYYENVGGIMGRETEMFMAPQPPRVTPWYKNDLSMLRDEARIMNVQDSGMSRGRRGSYGNNFKGVMIK